MYLDYSKLEFDIYGRPEVPELVLKTLSESTLGVLSGVHNLKMNIKFSEPSEISFDIPSVIDGMPNPLYKSVTGHKLIYTKNYGVYVTMNPTTNDDGISSIKSVKGYSIEKRLEDKRFFIEEGTFNFWNPASPQNTILQRIMEVAPDWSVGYVSPSLIGRYRTFDSYDNYLLQFIYNNAPEKFRCVFVFDPYQKTMNVYDADEERSTLPIYLDFENLLESVQVTELSDELVTALRPYGADMLDIRDVNPIGSAWLYDLSYFISNGDIPQALASKWNDWQALILSNQEHYKALVCMRASATSKLLKAEAELADLNGKLTDLKNQQSVTIQAIAIAKTAEEKTAQEAKLAEINTEIESYTKNTEGHISQKEAEINAIKTEINSYTAQLETIIYGDEDTTGLSVTSYFEPDEYEVLRKYFIEQDVTENSFVATDINTDASGANYNITSCNIYTSSKLHISMVDISETKQMYMLTGGVLFGSFRGDDSYSIFIINVVRGTLETDTSDTTNKKYILSLYVSDSIIGDKSIESGTITMSGILSSLTTDVAESVEDGITLNIGTVISLSAKDSSMYMTTNISEYQKYLVKMDLFDYASNLLHDLATPTYEFSVDSGNFIFAKEFTPFRNSLELGKGVYLNLRGNQIIKPLIIEFELDFEDRDKFNLVFSNRFKRHDSVNTLKDMLEKSYSSGRSFDASKYIYNRSAEQSTAVSDFMRSSLDAAKNSIIAASNQSVVIDGAGIHVGGDSNDQLRIINSMIAMTEDNWGTAKLAIGRFHSGAKNGNNNTIGEVWGVNAELLAGDLIIGRNLVLENPVYDSNNNATGVMQFKVDSTGAWLNNSTFVLQSDRIMNEDGTVNSYGGGIIIDPKWGIVAGTNTGTKNFFDIDGTVVTANFVGDDGKVQFDDDGFPANANFYLSVADGKAYFRGGVKATEGSIGGWTLQEDHLYSGDSKTYVALNASGTNNPTYAMWAGGEDPTSAPFSVTRGGNIYAMGGTFSGTLKGTLTGDTTEGSDGGWIVGCGIQITDSDGNAVFEVDQDGDVVMAGSITLSGNIEWSAKTNPCQVLYSRAYAAAPTGSYTAYPDNSATSWHKTATSDDLYASYTYDGGQTWTSAIQIRGLDGDKGEDAVVDSASVFSALTNGGTKFGCFSDEFGKLYINAEYIRGKKIDADLITLSGTYGGVCCASGSYKGQETTGAQLYGPVARDLAQYYFIATDAGARIQGTVNDVPKQSIVVGGSISMTENPFEGSDRRIKYDIGYGMSQYEDFFMRLKPTQYKLVNGDSGRFHTGFIAQDVEDALKLSGLSTLDFAGISITPIEYAKEIIDPCKFGITDNYYSLRYGEFISLNTYMIQKLYRRIEELESKLSNAS